MIWIGFELGFFDFEFSKLIINEIFFFFFIINV